MSSTNLSTARLMAHAVRSAYRLRNRHYTPLRLPQRGWAHRFGVSGRALR